MSSARRIWSFCSLVLGSIVSHKTSQSWHSLSKAERCTPYRNSKVASDYCLGKVLPRNKRVSSRASSKRTHLLSYQLQLEMKTQIMRSWMTSKVLETYLLLRKFKDTCRKVRTDKFLYSRGYNISFSILRWWLPSKWFDNWCWLSCSRNLKWRTIPETEVREAISEGD